MNPGTPLLAIAQWSTSKDVEDGQHLGHGPALLGQYYTSTYNDHPFGFGLLSCALPVSAHFCQVVPAARAALVEGLALTVAVIAYTWANSNCLCRLFLPVLEKRADSACMLLNPTYS